MLKCNSFQQVHRWLLRLRGLPHPCHLRGAFCRARRQGLEGIGEARSLGRRTRHAHQALGQGQVSQMFGLQMCYDYDDYLT